MTLQTAPALIPPLIPPLIPRLIVVTDTQRAPIAAWLERLDALLLATAPGSVQVQLRDRELPARERRDFGRQLRRLTARHGQTLAVNDRLDLAVLLEADGVHLGESSVLTADARAFGRRHGRDWFVTAACHEVERVRAAHADALLLSPVGEARKGRAALGAPGIEAAVKERERADAGGRCLLYALGGVTADNAATWLAAGADGVALIGELFSPGAEHELARALRIAR